MTNNDLMEGVDKAAFLRWLHTEIGIFGEMAPAERDVEVTRICQRWIRYKIREAAQHQRGRGCAMAPLNAAVARDFMGWGEE